MAGSTHISDWSPVPKGRYADAQKCEREYWSGEDPKVLKLEAQWHFYGGYYEWTKHRDVLDPFRVNSSRAHNFQLPGDALEGKAVLDIGCGPMSDALSLVHCAEVHAVDPLLDFYREIQPFGWEFFSSVSSGGAEQLPFDDGTFHFVHSRNVLDHTQDADRILREITRVLVPEGQLLLDCDVREEVGGGPAHPYNWRLDTFEARIFEHFKPVTAPALIDENKRLLSREECPVQRAWVSRLRKLPAD